MNSIDPAHEFVHKVPIRQMDRYMAYLQSEVKAECGKVWSPKRVLDTTKPECSSCFPKRPQFAIAV